MKTEVKQYNTVADTRRVPANSTAGRGGLAINAVLGVKEETRGGKEGKRKRRAEAVAAIEEGPKFEPKGGMSFVCDPLIHLTYLLDAIPVPMEMDEERN